MTIPEVVELIDVHEQMAIQLKRETGFFDS
jgi:hypothetical protein